MILNPDQISVQDICAAALQDANVVGTGQTPLAEDYTKAQARLQMMLQQWERKRWLVYHLVDLSVLSTGAISYSIGPGGDFDTGGSGQFNYQFNNQFGNAPGYQAFPTSARPARIESAFLRQIQSPPSQGEASANPYGGNLIDYPLTLLQSREDYNRIALKTLQTFPGYIFYDSAWSLGQLFPWPVPQPNIYEIHVSVFEQLPPAFATANTVISLPYEYFAAIRLNLAMLLRITYGIPVFPGDPLPGAAKDSLNVLRGANVQVARLQVPSELIRPNLYNIFSDRTY